MTEAKFDLKVTHHCPKTGNILRQSPYRCYKNKQGEFYERPPGCGNLFYADNTPAGIRTEEGKFLVGEEHKEYIAPATQKEAISQKLASQSDKINTLESKLIEAEKKNREFADLGLKVGNKGKNRG